MKTVYLGLGSNVGDREAMLQAAVNELHSREVPVRRLSSVYETEPMDLKAQRSFLNLVAEVQTDLFPQQLLTRVAKIEQHLGRRRVVAKGPRTIDIDILLYGNFLIRTPNLVIPHERLSERRFVLVPLLELSPELRDPVSRRPLREFLGQTSGQGIRKVEFHLEIPS